MDLRHLEWPFPEFRYSPSSKAHETYVNPMFPPWLYYPDLEPASIGWRMGSGEHYLSDFCQWFRTLPPDRRKTYCRQFPPTAGWEDFYDLFAR